MEKITELINVKRIVCDHKIYAVENKKADLNTMTPEEILNDYAECPDLFAVGQTKDITLKNGDKAILVISDFNHYEMEDGTKAPITFNFFTLIGRDRHMNDKLTNRGGWETCGMRKFLNGEFLEAFPDEWRPFLSSVKIKTWNGNEDNELTETVDKIFLNSEIEVQGRTVWSLEGEGQPLALFKDWRKRIIGYYGKETGWRYWLRSPASGYRGSFCNINRYGCADISYDNYAFGVAPCFCLAKKTAIILKGNL